LWGKENTEVTRRSFSRFLGNAAPIRGSALDSMGVRWRWRAKNMILKGLGTMGQKESKVERFEGVGRGVMGLLRLWKCVEKWGEAVSSE